MVQLSNQAEENQINGKLAILMIVASLALVVVAGVAIGNAFFWNKYDNTTKLDRDLEIALANVERDPNNAAYRVALGWAYFQLGELGNALPEYQNALQLEPKNSQAKFNLASAYMQSNQLEEARSLMEDYVKSNPLHASGHSILGLIYTDLGEYKLAITSFKESIKISPGNTNVYYQMANAYEQAGDRDNAKKYYQTTLDYNPKFEQAEQALQRLNNQ